ncbi:MAG: hypothetical protein ABI630_01925 [Betaproteobacteria bacterium]
MTGTARGRNETCHSGAESTRSASGGFVPFGARAVCAALVSIGLLAPGFATAAKATKPAAHAASAAHATKSAKAAKSADSEEMPIPAVTPQVRQMASWVLRAKDNQGLPFIIIDKVAAAAFVFHPDGDPMAAAPVLLGVAKGDDSVPGIGERELSDMPPEVRTTPAGRFVSSIGRNAHNKDVLWVDYDAAVSMHRVINTNPKDRRPQRLASPTPDDNRISYGCINVPIKFFDTFIAPTFNGINGIVYVLPETKPLKKVFTSFDDGESALASMPTRVESTAASRSVEPMAAARFGEPNAAMRSVGSAGQ